MAIDAGLRVVFVGESRHGAVRNHYPTRAIVPTGTKGVVVESTGKGILCDFRVGQHTVRMYAPKWELRKIKKKVA